MRPLLALLVAGLAAAAPLHAEKVNYVETTPPAGVSPQQGFEIEVHEDGVMTFSNSACVRLKATGNAFQPWNCEDAPAKVSATWLIAPGGDKRLAVTVRATGEPWILEHLVELGADGTTPKSYSAQLYRYNPDRCPVSGADAKTYIELSLHDCQVQRQALPGGVLYHVKQGVLVGGRLKASFAFVGTGSSFWGQNNTSADLDAAAIRTFRLDQPAKPGSLREASYHEAPDRDKPFRRYTAPTTLEL